MAKPDGWILKADVRVHVKEQLHVITGRSLAELSDDVLVSALVAQVDLAFWNQLLDMFTNYHLTLSDKDKGGVKTIGDIVDVISLKIHQRYVTGAMLQAFPPEVEPDPTYVSGARSVVKDVATDVAMAAIAGRVLAAVQALLPALPITALFVVPLVTIRSQWTWQRMMQVIVADVQQFEVH